MWYGVDKNDPTSYVLDELSTPMIMGPVSAQRWCYACAKQLVERLIFVHSTENGLKFTIVRPYNWIGPRMDYIPGVDRNSEGLPRVLASFMSALMKNEAMVLVNAGENFRTFRWVKDTIKCTVKMIERGDNAIGHAFNVGNPGNNIQVKELADIMSRLYKKLTGNDVYRPRVVDGEEYYGKGYEDSDLRMPSMKMVKSQLDWEPSLPLEEALEITMKSFIQQYKVSK